MGNINRSKVKNRNSSVSSGIDKHFTTPIVLGGVTYTPTHSKASSPTIRRRSTLDQVIGHDCVHDIVCPAFRHVATGAIGRLSDVFSSGRMTCLADRVVVSYRGRAPRDLVRIVASETSQPDFAFKEAARLAQSHDGADDLELRLGIGRAIEEQHECVDGFARVVRKRPMLEAANRCG